jgi:hypothetical protein
MGIFEEVFEEISVWVLEDPKTPPHLQAMYKGRYDQYHVLVSDDDIEHLTAEERECLKRVIYAFEPPNEETERERGPEYDPLLRADHQPHRGDKDEGA